MGKEIPHLFFFLHFTTKKGKKYTSILSEMLQIFSPIICCLLALQDHNLRTVNTILAHRKANDK